MNMFAMGQTQQQTAHDIAEKLYESARRFAAKNKNRENMEADLHRKFEDEYRKKLREKDLPTLGTHMIQFVNNLETIIEDTYA